jgi:hypothetical protein
LNYYENLKKYEIDHKKSAGAYLWIVTMEDPRAFRAWLALTDEQKRKTGIAAKKTPGSTLVLLLLYSHQAWMLRLYSPIYREYLIPTQT